MKVPLDVPLRSLGIIQKLASIAISPVPEYLFPQDADPHPVLHLYKAVRKFSHISALLSRPGDKIDSALTNILNDTRIFFLIRTRKHRLLLHA